MILTKKFLNTVKRINEIEQVSINESITTGENMGSEILTINVIRYFSSIINHFNREETRGKRNEITFNSFRSISRDNDYIDMKSVLCCSSTVEYNKRKLLCIKRFINMIKRPVWNFIGSDLLFPIISLIDKPIQGLSNTEIKQIMTSPKMSLLNYSEQTMNGPDYNKVEQGIENRNSIMVI